MPVYGWGEEVGLRQLLPSEVSWPQMKDESPVRMILLGYPRSCNIMLSHLNLGPFHRRRVMQIYPRSNPTNALAALRGVQEPEVILLEGCQDLPREVWDAVYQTRPIRIEGDPSYGTTLPRNWVRLKVDVAQVTFCEKPGPLQWP